MTRCRHKPPHLVNNFHHTIPPTIPEVAEDELADDDPPVDALPAQPEYQAVQHPLLPVLLPPVPLPDDQQAPLPPEPPGEDPGGQQADGPVQHGGVGRVTRSQARKNRLVV